MTPDAASSEAVITASIDALPSELLARIFSIGAASKPLVQHNEPPHFALLVSRVSRHWREVALAYPPLWSHLFFTTNPRSDRYVTDVFLPRSGTHPLDITIRRLDDETVTSMHQVLKNILPHCALAHTLCKAEGQCRFCTHHGLYRGHFSPAATASRDPLSASCWKRI
ncbi:hypothetical protein FIBSPDRAFT_470501 [Athelia psychrophila]|uniref:F-box domain-containing protein n=1 Tax=Athelia psychrophila TaxID=1759441 RepID=A0A167U174_9AGAM|nr:hypothetical protein FIBSPDRAFT_470501 [Fibularhizoctonia sp. CBS 109695]